MSEPVDIEFRINDRELEQSSRRVVDAVLGINSASEQTVRTLRSQMTEQKLLIKEIERDIKDIQAKALKMAPSRAKEELYAELHYAKRALDEEKASLKGLESQLDNAAAAAKRLASTKRELTDQMARLKIAGQSDSEQFRKLTEEATTVESAIRKVNNETKLLGSSDVNLQGLIGGLSGIAGFYSAGAGAAALFGTESKNLQQVQTRLQAIMASLFGLQQAYNALNKESAFQIAVVSKAKKMWTAAQVALNTQLGIGTVMSKAFMVSGIGLLLTAIAGLVVWYQNWRKEQEEINRIQTEFRQVEVDVARAMADQSVKVRALIAVASDYNASLNRRNEAIRNLKEIMPGYNGYIDQEGRLVANTDDALKNYLNTLYKVEKAKKVLAKISDTEARIEEKKITPIEDPGFGDKMKVIAAMMLGRGEGAKLWQEVRKEKEQEYEDEITALEESKKHFENELTSLLNDDAVFQGVFGNTSKVKSVTSSSPAKSQLDSEEKINKEMRELAARNITERIALMDEGTQKELAQIENRYNQVIDKIRDREKEWRAAQGGQLTQKQEQLGQDEKTNATNQRIKDEEDVINQLANKYKDYATQRKGVEEQYNRDLEGLRMLREKAVQEENEERIQETDRMISHLVKKQGQDLIQLDFDILKQSPEYVRAFEDLKNTSTETLTTLLTQLEAAKGAATSVLDPTDLREYTTTIQQIITELTQRNPLGMLAQAQNKLAQSTNNLSIARKKLDEARSSGTDEEKVQAEKEYREALDETYKANNNLINIQKEVNKQYLILFEMVSKVGDIIGGQAGEIIGLIGNIGSFVVSAIDKIETTANAGAFALASLEKASAILTIIQLAIQLISKIGEMLPDMNQQYEQYAAKLAEINKLRDAVNEYEIAVLKAKHAEDAWFAKDRIRDLGSSKIFSGKYKEAYYDKLGEEQAAYVNENGDGWLTRWAKEGLEASTRIAHGDILGGIEAYKRNKPTYDKNKVKASDNLRIQTRERSGGFLGTGIGGKSQQTADLREWARENNFGELFDNEGMIHIKTAEKILEAHEKGVIKLVGETEETLKVLKENAEKYKEYQTQLQEYVSDLYAPLVDNMVDAIWDWFDEGKDAMDSFKQYASQTFREIANELVKHLVNKHVFAGFDKSAIDLYDKFFAGEISEEELYQGLAKATEKLEQRLEQKLPIIQDSLVGLSDTLSGIGIDISKPDKSQQKQQAEKGFHTTVSQDSFNEWLGQFVAIRIHVANMYSLFASMNKSEKDFTNHLIAIEKHALNIVDQLRDVNNRLQRIEIEGIKMK